MLDFIGMWEQAKQELEGMWASLDTAKSAAQASDAIKRYSGTPENANMVEAIEKARKGAEPVVLAPAPTPTPDPAPVSQELDLFEDTAADTALADLGAEGLEAPVELPSVDDVIASVESVFPSNGFLSEIATVESRKGEDPDTYREGYHGGVMQVDKIGFEDTQDTKSHPALVSKFKRIKDEFGIDWAAASWEDLRDPLHSTIAARLLLSNKEDVIPDTVEGRAKYWKDKYNTVKGKGTTEKYLKSLGK